MKPAASDSYKRRRRNTFRFLLLPSFRVTHTHASQNSGLNSPQEAELKLSEELKVRNCAESQSSTVDQLLLLASQSVNYPSKAEPVN